MWILAILIICGVITLIGWMIGELLKENNITCSFCGKHTPLRQSTYINDVPKEKSRDDIFLEKLSNIEDTHTVYTFCGL